MGVGVGINVRKWGEGVWANEDGWRVSEEGVKSIRFKLRVGLE